MALEKRIEAVVADFSRFPDWEGRYKHLINLGKNLPAFPEELKIEDLKVKGCQSQVWIHASLTDDKKILFKADSDALIVKGLVSVLLKIYSEASPSEILATPPNFIEDLGFKNHLSPSRANGFYSMVKQIQYYATAFQVLLSR